MGVEIALDLQAVSAACPTCHILLVESDDNSYVNIGKAVNRAVALGAKIVSNSYGGDEFGSSRQLAKTYYTHPGVAQVVSSGDYGFGAAQFPAVLPQAVAAGGTTLTKTAAGGWSERPGAVPAAAARPGTPSPPGSRTRTAGCGRTADVSAVADPDTGLAVYDTSASVPTTAGSSSAAPAWRRRSSRA